MSTGELADKLRISNWTLYIDIDEETNERPSLKAFEDDHPDVVITDESLPRMCGTALAHEVKSRQPKTGVVLVSGYSDVDASCCDVVLRKPVDVERLSAVIGTLGEAARH